MLVHIFIVTCVCRCGAKTQFKNKKGDTAYDLALKLGYESMANKIAAAMGQNTLNNLLRPKIRTDSL